MKRPGFVMNIEAEILNKISAVEFVNTQKEQGSIILHGENCDFPPRSGATCQASLQHCRMREGNSWDTEWKGAAELFLLQMKRKSSVIYKTNKLQNELRKTTVTWSIKKKKSIVFYIYR